VIGSRRSSFGISVFAFPVSLESCTRRLLRFPTQNENFNRNTHVLSGCANKKSLYRLTIRRKKRATQKTIVFHNFTNELREKNFASTAKKIGLRTINFPNSVARDIFSALRWTHRSAPFRELNGAERWTPS
jgi:hypothetical protein